MPGFARRRGRPPSPGTFTPAEERLLPLIARGLTNAEIAAQTGLSTHTVHSHIATMLSKTGARDRQELGRIEPARRPDGARALFGLPLRIAAGALATATLTVAVAAIAFAARGDDAGTPAAPLSTPFPTSTVTPAPSPIGGPLVVELLARPLRMPSLAAGEACPVEAARTVSATFGPATGSGPAYLVGLTRDSALPNFTRQNERPPAGYENWGAAKTLFAAELSERGPFVLRGRRIDGPGIVAFEHDGHASGELVLVEPRIGNMEGWFEDVFATLVKDPGCYAIQVDGASFSEVIVFRAVF